MNIYGLVGKKKSGKDLFATIVHQEISMKTIVRRFSFANALKKFVVEYLGVPEKSCFGTQEDKAEYIGKFSDYFSNKFCDYIKLSPDTSINGRMILQLVGTEIFRQNFKDSIWIDIVMRQIKTFELDKSSQIAMITDVRFPNEMFAIKNRGGKLIRLYRHTDDLKDSHPSERAMDEVPSDMFDYIVTKGNNANKADLKSYVKHFLNREKLL